MSDNPSPIPVPDDITILPNPVTKRVEAVPFVQWNAETGRYQCKLCLMVADARHVMFAAPDARIQFAMVPLEADGTLSPEKCRAGLVEIGVRKADDA